MRIAVLSDPELLNSNYRAYQPMGALARRGHQLLYNTSEQPIRPETLLEVDVVHMHRIATPEMRQLIGRVREAGVGVVWDNDDDVTAVPKSNPLYARFGGSRRREMRAGVRAMVRLADVITTPSAVLADQYRELGAADARVLENYMPPEFAKVRPAKHRGVAIVCLAALEHQVDYQELGLHGTLRRLLDAHPDLRVTSLGLGLGLDHERYENRKRIPFLELAWTLSHFDIGIAPLVDIRRQMGGGAARRRRAGAGAERRDCALRLQARQAGRRPLAQRALSHLSRRTWSSTKPARSSLAVSVREVKPVRCAMYSLPSLIEELCP